MNSLANVRHQMNALMVYRNLLTDETVSRFLRLLKEAEGGDAASFCAAYGEFFFYLSRQDCALDFAAHLEKQIFFDDNPFSKAAAKGESSESYRRLKQAVVCDMASLRLLAVITFSDLKSSVRQRNNAQDSEMMDMLPSYFSYGGFIKGDPDVICVLLEEYHRKNGYGVFAEFGAFRWTGELVGIRHPDPIRLGDLKEYEYERGLVSANTLDFIKGRGGGNLLLYGDRGTGKSSTIKALANEYRKSGLRIVEIVRDDIATLPALLEQLRDVPQKFILFLDDLTFSSDDTSFSALKSILEGGVVARPDNCLLYATSNRRHLVKESFSERSADDVHAGDTMQEKLALSDRFDLTVNFFAPDQAKYLSIVRALAQERKLAAEPDALERGAVQWAIRAGGRSPRTAKQFIEWAKLQIQKGASIMD